MQIPDPENYYEGVDSPDRPVSRNALLFLRTSRRTLQQKHLANRMHHRYVLMFALETAGVVSVDGQSIHLHPGEALLVFPYQFHHYIDLQKNDLRWLFVTFELQQGEARLQPLSLRRLGFDVETESRLHRMADIWNQADPAARAEILPMLDRLLLQWTRTAVPPLTAGEASMRSRHQNPWIVEVEGLVIRSVGEGWTLDEVARRMGLSGRHLRTRFEAATGVSLRDYRSNYQLHRALALMRDPALSLGRIAELCGFHSQSVFTRFIARQTGMPPRKLRESRVAG